VITLVSGEEVAVTASARENSGERPGRALLIAGVRTVGTRCADSADAMLPALGRPGEHMRDDKLPVVGEQGSQLQPLRQRREELLGRQRRAQAHYYSLHSVVSAPEWRPEQKFGLTEREFDVVQAIVAGYSNKDIASQLSISEQTVKHHLGSIFDKLRVFSRLELALFALNHQLVGRS